MFSKERTRVEKRLDVDIFFLADESVISPWRWELLVTLAPKFHGTQPCILGCNYFLPSPEVLGGCSDIFVTLFEHSEPQMRRHLQLPAESTAHVWSGALHLSFRVHNLSFPMKFRRGSFKSKDRSNSVTVSKRLNLLGLSWNIFLENNFHWTFNRRERQKGASCSFRSRDSWFAVLGFQCFFWIRHNGEFP